MRRNVLLLILMGALFTSAGLAFQAGTASQPGTGGPYKVLRTAKVGGEGGTDYIYADTAGRRLYITRGELLVRCGVARRRRSRSRVEYRDGRLGACRISPGERSPPK